MNYKGRLIYFFIILSLFANCSYASGKERLPIEFIEFAELLLRFVGLGFLLLYLQSVSWTKIMLGGFLCLIGAFFPRGKVDQEKEGKAKISFGKLSFELRGGVRFAVVIAGIILIFVSVYDGVTRGEENISASYKSIATYGLPGMQVEQMNDSCLMVVSVIKGGPADNAGVKKYDLITEINNISIEKIYKENVFECFKGLPGTTLRLAIISSGKRDVIDVVRVETSELMELSKKNR